MTNSTEIREHIECGYDLIALHRWNAKHNKTGRDLGKAPSFGWRTCPPLEPDKAIDVLESGINIGVRLTETDLVIDVDPKNFEAGDNPWFRLCRDLGIKPNEHPTVITGSGGKHIYMKRPANILLMDSHPDYVGVEFKSIGRQVVAPGSKHPNGKLYEKDFLTPHLKDVQDAPKNLLAIIQRAVSLENDSVGGGQFTPDELDEMLAHLDPTNFRDQDVWLRLAMSCHHATNGDGRQEFINWCISDPQYSDHAGVIGLRWDSFTRNSGAAGTIVTYKTLLHYLNAAGAADAIPQKVDVDFPDDISADELAHIVKTKADDELNPIDAMNKEFCAVIDGSDFFIFKANSDDVIKKTGVRLQRLKQYAFHSYLENRLVEDEKGKAKKLSAVWMQHPRRRTYDGVIFEPNERTTGRCLNLWAGWAVVPSRKGSWSLLNEMLFEALCSGDNAVYEYVLNWSARMVQNPGEPGQVAIAFRGGKGLGKSTWGKALAYLAGRHSLTATTPQQITGRFNDHLRDKVFLFADEAISPYDKAGESQLKALITEEMLSYEGKGRDIVQAKNCLHIMLASNYDAVVPAGLDGERRFLMQDVSPNWAEKGLFTKLHAQLKNGGYEALLWDLLNRDIINFNVWNVPQTAALAEQKLLHIGPIGQWWNSILESGNVEEYYATSEEHNWAETKGYVPLLVAALRKSYRNFSEKELHISAGRGGRGFEVSFSKNLNKFLPDSAKKTQMQVDPDMAFKYDLNPSSQHAVLYVPSLALCRKGFDDALGSKYFAGMR